MVSALDSGSSGPGSGPGWGHCVVFLGKTLYSHGASRHPGVWVPANLMLGVTLRWTSGGRTYPGGRRNTPSRFIATETGDKRPDGPSRLLADSTFTLLH